MATLPNTPTHFSTNSSSSSNVESPLETLVSLCPNSYNDFDDGKKLQVPAPHIATLATTKHFYPNMDTTSKTIYNCLKAKYFLFT